MPLRHALPYLRNDGLPGAPPDRIGEDTPLAATSSQGVPLSRIIYEFSPDYISGLISVVLRGRAEASKGARSSLNSAIRDGVRIDGFRNASRADPVHLAPYVLDAFRDGDDRLVGVVLRVWTELRRDLFDLIVAHLGERDMPVSGPNLRKRCFDETWPAQAWMEEIEAVLGSNEGLDEDDVGMMLCYVSGRAPEAGRSEADVRSPRLRQWLDELRELPPEAPEWEDIYDFIDIAGDVAATKDIERVLNLTAEFARELASTGQEYEAELRYMEIDLLSWAESAARRPGCLSRAVEVTKSLEANLAEYRSVLPQADSRKEELARAVVRAEREQAILDVVGEWDRLMEEFPSHPDSPPVGEEDLPDEEAMGSDSDSDGQEEGRPGEETPSGSAGVMGQGESVTMEEYGRLAAECESLRAENVELRRNGKDHEADRRSLSGENSGLRDELALSRSLEESWRQAYVDSRVARVEVADEPPPASVSEAVARAEKVFPDQLVIALNSKSDKSSAFQKPVEVFDALAWLATDYHQLRSNPPGKPPPFDKRLKLSCPGWSYKPHQAALTKEKFDAWYRTEADGRPYDLGAHLRKGADRDPQTTIRIAFAWDDERNMVIVGYIGLHQKNRLD